MGTPRTVDHLVGRSLGEFVLRERIGEGGFGAVYRAIQPALDREAVVKVLHARLHAATAATERFLREAKLASKLDHPYAAHVYAFGVDRDGEHWIAMELVRGTPLDDVLHHQGVLSLERLSPLLDRICEVVHTAHEQGIVHRDLKPANVMVLSRAGRLLPKLLDFGIAKGLEAAVDNEQLALDRTMSPDVPINVAALRGAVSLDATLDANTGVEDVPATPSGGVVSGLTPSRRISQLTQEGAIMGSPAYMAPEQWLDAGDVDRRVDLYALGVLAYECLTGKTPFTGKTVQEIARAHAKNRPPPLGDGFPQALDTVFAKVLAKRADDRYADALEFAEAFRTAAGVTTEPARLPTLETALRVATLNEAPQPIAEAVASYEGARNAHQARDALALVARTLVRYIGLLAVACRSRVEGKSGGAELMRSLAVRALDDREWLDLARSLTEGWRARRDAYPVPELVTALHDGTLYDDLAVVFDLREHDAPGEGALITLLEDSLARLARALEALAFLRDYPLVVTTGDGAGDSWMGVRHARRRTVVVRGKNVEPALPVLLDKDGAPVLSLAPLFQLAEPTPGAPRELFMFDGRGRRGAKLVAWPTRFEWHDDTMQDWLRTQIGSLEERAATIDDGVAPYRGLSAFSARDSAMFFGRESQVDAFMNRLQLQPLLAIVGPSGAGKSSFVHAGVVPALPADWRTITMRPGASPMAALAARLEHATIGRDSVQQLREAVARERGSLGEMLRADAAAHGPIVLVVDQLEEIFTLCQDDAERRLFAEAVSAAARDAEDRVRVIFTLRDDFLVRTEQVPALRNRIGQGLQLLTVPVAEDLRRIVVEPARRTGYQFEDDALPSEMVAEVADQPGALALISFTAQKLWELRDRHFKQLTRSAYKTLGGVGGALAQHAEQTLGAMPAEERALTREAFRHLVTSLDTRAVVARGDLRKLLGNDASADSVIEKLVAARLLVASDSEAGSETVEVVHEALLGAWPRLVEWRREDREGARFREQLRTAAKQWDDRGRARGLLWRGDALAELTRWRVRHPGPLTDLEAAFAEASARDAARGRRNLRLIVALGFAALGAILIILSVSRSRIANGKREAENANDNLHHNLEQQWEAQGRLLVLQGDPLKGLTALAHAGELGARGRGHDLLIAEAIQATDGALHTLVHGGPVRAPQFSHDGTRVVTGSMDGKARVWDASSGALAFELPHGGAITRTAFSRDDSTVLTGSFDGTARLWNAKTGEELRRFDHHGKTVWCALFSPDGKLALTGGDDDAVVLWDLASHTEKLRVHGQGLGTTACAFSPDGELFAAGDGHGAVRVWRTATGEPVQRHADQTDVIGEVAFSHDGTHLFAASNDHTAIGWTVATGHLDYRLEHADSVYSIELSPDGKRVITGSIDRTAVVWDAATGERLFALTGHTGGVYRAAFSPDATSIVTSSEDGSTRLWDASTGRALATWWHEDVVFDFAFDARGERVVTVSNDGKAVIWAVQRQGKGVVIRAPRGTNAARLSRDGTAVALGNRDGVVRVYDTRSGGLLAELASDTHSEIQGVAFDATGRYLATATNSADVRIWDTHAPKSPPHVLAGKTESTSDVDQLDWKGELIVTAADNGFIRLWNSTSGALQFEKAATGGVGLTGVTFDPHARSITAVTYDGMIQSWSLTGQLLATEQAPAQPWQVVFDPTGTRMLLLNSKRAIEIRDVATKSHELDLFGHLGHVTDAAWSPGGEIVVTSALDGTVRLWDAKTGDPLQIIQHAGRQAWVDFAPDGRFLAAEDDGFTLIGELPAYRGGPAAFQKLLRCRVPFIVKDDRFVLRGPTDRADCEARE